MSLHRPAVMLAAALVLGATAAPTVAFADGTTPAPAPITAAQLRTDLNAAQAASLTAEKAGWALDGTDSLVTGAAAPAHAAYNGTVGIFTEIGFGKIIEAAGSGTYISKQAFAASAGAQLVRSALNAIARPDAAFVFQADKTLDLVTGDGMTASLSPAGTLGMYLKRRATYTNPTETSAADGSTTTYSFTVKIPRDPADSGDITLTIGADDVLQSVDAVGSTGTYAYAAQPAIALPASSTYVTDKQLTKGMMLTGMARDAKMIAKTVAAKATTAADKHAVRARTIRPLTRSVVWQLNGMYGMRVFTTRNVARGVRITGTNPYTHAKAVWTVTAAGKKAVARRG